MIAAQRLVEFRDRALMPIGEGRLSQRETMRPRRQASTAAKGFTTRATSSRLMRITCSIFSGSRLSFEPGTGRRPSK